MIRPPVAWVISIALFSCRVAAVPAVPQSARVDWPTDSQPSASEYGRGGRGIVRVRGSGRGRGRGRNRGNRGWDAANPNLIPQGSRGDGWDYKHDRPGPAAGDLDERRPYERGVADGASEYAILIACLRANLRYKLRMN